MGAETQNLIQAGAGAGVSEAESGQSILEFVMMLPLGLGLAIMLLKVNTAIQMSIVNQQVARAHALWLTFNSAHFPQRDKIMDPKTGMPFDTAKGFNQMLIGVSDNVAPEDGDTIEPEASTLTVSRAGKPAGSDDAHAEPAERGKVRIRTTVTLCSQSNWVTKDMLPATASNMREDLMQDDGYRFCRSNYE